MDYFVKSSRLLWTLLAINILLVSIVFRLVWPLAYYYKPTYIAIDVRNEGQASLAQGGIEVRWGDNINQAVSLTPRPDFRQDPNILYWDATLPAISIPKLSLRFTGTITRVMLIDVGIWSTPSQSWVHTIPLHTWTQFNGIDATSTDKGVLLQATSKLAELHLIQFVPITQQYERVESYRTWFYNLVVLSGVIIILLSWFVRAKLLTLFHIIRNVFFFKKHLFYVCYNIQA